MFVTPYITLAICAVGCLASKQMVIRNGVGYSPYTQLVPCDMCKDSNVTDVEPRFFCEYGSQRKQITYGPFTVPGCDDSDQHGMITYPIEIALKPCENCLITFLNGSLEYPDGTDANFDNGMILHHSIVSNGDRMDMVCPEIAERIIAVGSERTPFDLSGHGQMQAGYYLGAGNVSIQTELMNFYNYSRDAVLRLDFEFIPENHTDFMRLRPMWLDASGICGPMEIEIPDDGGPNFNLTQEDFILPFDGYVTGVAGHVHDAGVYVKITKNGEVVCDSPAGYGETPGYISEDGIHHLSSMKVCQQVGEAKAGDAWTLTAYYDLYAHEPMLNGSVLASVMGCAIGYISDPSDHA